MRSHESYGQKNVAAGTYGPIYLEGGQYQLAAHATWGGGNLALQQLLPDGSTFLGLFGQPNTATPTTYVATLTADGTLLFSLPPGTYQLVVTTATGSSFALTRVPTE